MAQQPDIDNSRLLDVHRHSDYPAVREWVDAFWDDHIACYFPEKKGKRGPKAKSNAKTMFRVLFLDLYVSWLEDPTQCLGFSRSDNSFSVGSRYNKLFISKDIKKVADALLEQGFIDHKLGSEAARKVTRIWPLEPLIEYFRTAAFPEFLIDIHEGKECIVLRKDGKEIEYEDKDAPFDIQAARELLQSYNALLRLTHIDLGSQPDPIVLSQHYNKKLKRTETRRVSLRHDNKFVRRIFYRGDWHLGGRYHGGWWQQIPSELRKSILIDDQYTVEVDFSGFHVSLAYGLEGLQPPDDPYELKVSIGNLSRERQRKDVKLLVLTAINAKDRASAFKAFRNDKNQDQRNLPASQKIKYTNKLLTGLMDAFEAENQPIAHYLSSDKGVEFMGLDGQITEKVIEHFTNKGVPILTIHDSYIIESSYEQELKNVMQEATKQVLGDGGLTIRQVLLSEALTEEEFKRLVDEIESDPVNELRFRIKQEKLSPAAIQAVAKVDRTVNPVDALINLEDLVVRTLGYEQRYERFQRYLKEYHPDR